MYKLQNLENRTIAILRILDMASIPFAPDNTDYQQFVRDIKNGVQLNDAEGNQMTPEQITTFLEGLA
jgi:hypothetical protein